MWLSQLNYPLSVLTKAVEFKNLSSASLHVGLSQPQLSRLVSKLERELGMELLNRQVKRKSSWTHSALQVAALFDQHQRRLDQAMRTLQSNQVARQVHIGTLEGLTDLAIDLAKRLFDKLPMETVTLDVFDRSELEAKFLAGDLDVILNTRPISKSKPRFSHVRAYQTLEHIDRGGEYQLFSSFEFSEQRRAARRRGKTVVSNSLSVRKSWLEKFGGKGSLPSPVTDKPRKGFDEILLLGGDWLDPRVWVALT